MTITGKLNAEEDTIFLKVQIAEETAGTLHYSDVALHHLTTQVLTAEHMQTN